MMQRAISFFHKENSSYLWGPVFLICTLGMATWAALPIDFLIFALMGIFTCAIWEKKGFLYTLVVLGLWAAIKHSLIDTGHLWQFGLEGSLACAFFITSAAFEQGSAISQSFRAQVDTRQTALKNLEEELSKVQEENLSQQVSTQERLSVLQKELEELQTEHSSILVLNDVLRQTNAKQAEENEQLIHVSQDRQAKLDSLIVEFDECQKELDHYKKTDLALENGQLMKDLNGARLEREQTRMNHENLMKLHAKESLRAKEALEEIAKLEELLFKSQSEGKTLSTHVEQLSKELEKARNEISELKDSLVEKKFLQERLANAQQELSNIKRPIQQVDNDHLVEEISKAKEKISSLEMQLNDIHLERNFFQKQYEDAKSEVNRLGQRSEQDYSEELTRLSQIEPLFRQLKQQFEEKNQILSQTRAELFKADTELQTLKLEQKHLELAPLAKDMEEQIKALANQLRDLEEENKHLHDLVTILNNDSSGNQKKN